MGTAPSFRTWVTGEVVTAAFMNSNIRDGGNFFLNRPICEVRQTVAQSIPSGVFTALTFDTEDVDTDNMHSTVTNPSRITPQTIGRYSLYGVLSLSGNSAARRVPTWYINGSEMASAGRVESPPYTSTAAANFILAARLRSWFFNGTSDYAELQVFQQVGTINTSVSPAGEQPSVFVRMLGNT